MADMTLQDRRAYIASLELAEPRITGADPHPVTFDGGDDVAYVDEGSIVSFVRGISEEHRRDVLNSTLLAQAVADKALDREKQTVE